MNYTDEVEQYIDVMVVKNNSLFSTYITGIYFSIKVRSLLSILTKHRQHHYYPIVVIAASPHFLTLVFRVQNRLR